MISYSKLFVGLTVMVSVLTSWKRLWTQVKMILGTKKIITKAIITYVGGNQHLKGLYTLRGILHHILIRKRTRLDNYNKFENLVLQILYATFLLQSHKRPVALIGFSLQRRQNIMNYRLVCGTFEEAKSGIE